MSGLRRNNSSCGTNSQYTPYMLGPRTFGGNNARVPTTVSVNTMSAPTPSYYAQPSRTTSLNDASVSVRECMYWPASLNSQSSRGSRSSQARSSYSTSTNYSPQNNSGDFQYCASPPKVYINALGPKGRPVPQNLPCQVAPLGTDPMSMIKPLAPLTVRVQAPADLFSGDPSQPKTISISPNQLYGL